MDHQYNPDITLNRGQQAALAQQVAGEGWKVTVLLWRAEVDKYIEALINASTGSEDVMERHRVVKTACQIVEGLARRITHEVSQYVAVNAGPTAPVDLTAGIIDLGPEASRIEDLALEEEHNDNEF